MPTNFIVFIYVYATYKNLSYYCLKSQDKK